MATNCIGCGAMAKMKCGRCGVAYCTKQCQIKDWPIHKPACIPDNVPEYLRHINTRVSGNILIMAAHKSVRLGPGTVTIEISENIEDFVRGGLHILYITYCPAERVIEGAVPVTYKLNNYSWATKIWQDIDFQKIRDAHPEPHDMWTVMIEL